mgnify:FL=1
MKNIYIVFLAFALQSCQSQNKEQSKKMEPSVKKTEAEWKTQLSEMEYEVLRNKDTERAFTGEYYNHFEKGNMFI